MCGVTFCSALATTCTTCFNVQNFRISPTDFVYSPTVPPPPGPTPKKAEYFQAHRSRIVVFALETETKYLNGYNLPSLLASCCVV